MEVGRLLEAVLFLQCFAVDQALAGDQKATLSVFVLSWQLLYPAVPLYRSELNGVGHTLASLHFWKPDAPFILSLTPDECCLAPGTKSVRRTENNIAVKTVLPTLTQIGPVSVATSSPKLI